MDTKYEGNITAYRLIADEIDRLVKQAKSANPVALTSNDRLVLKAKKKQLHKLLIYSRFYQQGLRIIK